MRNAARPALQGIRVLVVEDDYFIADATVAALRLMGAEVVGPYSCVREALASAKAEGIDAAVVDINLDGCLSYPVADALSARGTPYLFATGYSARSMPEAYKNVAHWEKPFALPAMLGSLLGLEAVPR